MPHHISRRNLLGGLGAAAGVLSLGGLSLRQTMAAGDKPPLVVQITFSGGWDTLLTLDPRSNLDFTDPDGKIYPAYDLAANGDPLILDALANTNGTGVFTDGPSGMTLGPSVPASLRAMASAYSGSRPSGCAVGCEGLFERAACLGIGVLPTREGVSRVLGS